VLDRPIPLVQSADRYLTAKDFLQQNLQGQSASNASVAFLLAQMNQRGL
jgi:hypothetical protein